MDEDVKLFGRTVIMSDADKIDESNLLTELNKAMVTHLKNSAEIDYLYRIYKGDQPILNRVKEIRPEICNKVVVNIANEIVTFKSNYQCGEPIQYIGMSKDESVTEDVALLNKYMALEGKEAKDQLLFDWMFIAGVGNRFVKPRKLRGADDAPYELYTLDPRSSFVVYSSDIDHHKMMGVKYRVKKIDNVTEERIYSVYTSDKLYTVSDDGTGGKIISAEPHTYGTIPIFEYPCNNARLGSFELVLSMMNAINTVESNRIDGIEQNIQAFLKFINCEVNEEQMDALRELGAIMIKSTDGQKADVESVTTDIDQNQTQTTKDDLYNTILTICGMPNRNGGSSTSDTGAAVEMRDGWSAAEARAKGVENLFKQSEREMLKFVLKILRDLSSAGEIETLSPDNPFDLKLMDTDIKSPRRNYQDIQSKAQVLIQMLDNEKVHPLNAYTACGMFTDPESAYQMGMDWYDKQREEEAKQLDDLTVKDDEPDANV